MRSFILYTSSTLSNQGAAFARLLKQLPALLSSSLSSPPSPASLLSLLSSYRAWWLTLYRTDPLRLLIETGLILFILLVLLLTRTRKQGKFAVRLSEAEKEELIKSWEPAALAPDLTKGEAALVAAIAAPRAPAQTNLCSFDFLSLSRRPELREASAEALTEYGCGSCGPRGFYGTIEPHLRLEAKFAEMHGTKDSIMYSDGNSCVSSTLAAFAKRGDLLVVDEGLYESLTTGATLSRSNVKTFRHNDAQSLRGVLEKIRKEDMKRRRNAGDQRRFIVVEGVYRMYGDVAPLDEIAALKSEFGYRLIVDESLAFGVLGDGGWGAAEHFGVEGDVEIRTASLENAVASIGGITVGDEEVVDHQRLSGAGYCFSASAPPFVAAAAVASLEILGGAEGKVLRRRLRENIGLLREGIGRINGVELWRGSELSPLVFFTMPGGSEESERERLRQVTSALLKSGVSVACTSDHDAATDLLITTPRPTIRVTANAGLSKKDVMEVLRKIEKAVKG